MKHIAESVAASLALIRAKLEIAKGNWNRFPAGTPKGGQFAPKGQAGGGQAGKFNAQMSSFFPGTGSLFKPKEKPKGAAPHPKAGERGETVTIDYPSKPSGRETWRDAKATATFTPGSATPPLLHGVPVKPWKAPTTAEGWAKVPGQNPALDARMPFVPTPGKSVGAGVVVMEPDGRVWLTKPTNEFGGYKHTFPKGTAEPGLSLQANAIKEAWEETGLKVQIVGVLGDFERTTSKARFYLARRVGGTPADMGWETQAVRLAPLKNAMQLLNMAHDRSIISNVKGVRLAKAAGWTKQPRWPAGSALGGQWKSYDSEGLPMPPKVGSATNAAYSKAAGAAYQAIKAGDSKTAADVAVKYASAAAAYNVAGGKGVTYHVKEGAKVHQYTVDLLAAYGNKLATGAAQAKNGGPDALDSYQKTGGKPGGSNPGGLYAKGGETYLVKGNAQLVNGNVSQAVSDDRAKNEVLASELMKAAGVGAPDMKLVDLQGQHGGGLGVASKWMQGQAFDPSNPAHLAAAQQGFAVHAWLANHDVVGLSNDNLKMIDGKAVNIDPGGALLFRAQGLPKTGFGTDVPELKGMRDPAINPAAAKVYGSMTQAQIKESAKQLAQIDDATIQKLVDAHGPGDAKAKADLAETLIKRKQYVMGFAGLNPDGTEPKPAPPAAAPAAKPAATVAKPAAPSGLQHLQAVYTLQDGKSNKFWGVTVSGNTLVTHYGKIGTKGSTTTKTFGSELEANAAASKLVGEKLGKGYGYAGKNGAPQPVLDALSQAGFAAPKAKPAGIGSPPPEDMAVDTNPAVLPQVRAPKAPAGPAPGQFPPPPALIGGSGVPKSLKQAANALHDDGLEGKTPVVTVTPGGIKVYSPTLGTHVTVGNPPKTAAGKAVVDYANAAIAHVQAQQAAATAATVQQAQASMAAVQQQATVQQPPKPGQHAGNLPAMPDFDKAKLPTTNSNAQSHNAKVDKIAQLAASGDVTGLLAQGYGSNTYGKQQAKLANSALAAMGVSATVTAGQKANAHPGINGGVSPDKAAAAMANAGTPVPPQQVAPATKGKIPNVPVNALPAKTDFTGANGGKGLSSVAWVNQQNQELQSTMERLAKAGDLAALQALTFDLKDKATGKSTGKVAGISEHPSKNIQIYWNDSIALLRDLQSGPARPLKIVDTTAVKSASDVASHFPAKPLGTTVSKVKSNEKFGFWVALGSVSNPSVLTPKKSMSVDPAEVQKSYDEYKAMPPLAKKFVNFIQASGSFNDAFRDGKTEYNGYNLKDLAKAAKAAAKESPEGTTVYRWQNMPPKMLAQLEAAQPGLVFQSTGPMCTSMSPTATKGFGNHRVKIVFAKGAKAVHSYGSGAFSGEKEVSTLPGARFVLLNKKKFTNGNYDIEVLMLPPDKNAI